MAFTPRPESERMTDSIKVAGTLHSRIALCLLLAVVSGSGRAWGQDPEAPWTFSAYFENDLFADSDRNYTNGVKVSWVSSDITKFIARSRGWLRPVVNRLPFIHGKDRTKNFGLSIGQNIYTPDDISRTDLIADDRPYAGWLYMGFAFHSRSPDNAVLDTFEIQLGVVGPLSYGEQAQRIVHEIRDLQIPAGWDHQLHNEPGGVLLYEHKKRLIRSALPAGLEAECISRIGGAAGNIAIYGVAGLEARAGWHIPEDFGNPAIRPAGDIMPLARRSIGFGMHVFASAEARGVLRDIFLDGNTVTASHRVEKKNLVRDLAVGLSVNYRGWKLTYAQVFRSREFDLQPGNHTFGSITASLSL